MVCEKSSDLWTLKPGNITDSGMRDIKNFVTNKIKTHVKTPSVMRLINTASINSPRLFVL